MSKTNSAVLWLEAEIVRLKRELAEHELARNIMMRFEEKPATTKTEVAEAYVKSSLPVWPTARQLEKIENKNNPQGYSQSHTIRNRIRAELKRGPETSGRLILKIVGLQSSKQDKQLVYVALHDLKKHGEIDQFEDSRKYHLKGRA